MKDFAFEDKKIKKRQISIRGKKYYIRYDVKTMKAIERYTLSMTPIIKKMESKNVKDMIGVNIDVSRITKRFLDDTLGKHAYDNIFLDRPMDIEEHCRVVQFIFEEIAKNEYTA